MGRFVRICHPLSHQSSNHFYRRELGEEVVQLILVNNIVLHICQKTHSGMHTSTPFIFVICNKQASDRSIELINRLQHARHEHRIVVASAYERLGFTP
jgi:hypothetical protein